jgi:hypothetical protein
MSRKPITALLFVFCASPAFATSTASTSLTGLSVNLTALGSTSPALSINFNDMFSRRIDASAASVFVGGYDFATASASFIGQFGSASAGICCVDSTSMCRVP